MKENKTIFLSASGTKHPILIENGLIHSLPEWVYRELKPSKVMILTNKKLEKLYGKKVLSNLKKYNKATFLYSVKDGERFKNKETLFDILSQLRKYKFQRDSCLLTLGGGVVGDLGGFAAAVYMRGISFVQFPTTLLSQVDASVGGKTAIDFGGIKNLIGAFYQPKGVLIDPEVLSSLDDRNFRTGLSEVIKYGIIYDPRFFKFLENNILLLLRREPKVLLQAIYRSCQIKSLIVSKDEKEKGIRAWLNYGHTLGHALEAYYHFEGITHGEAIAYGMRFASLLALELGLCDQSCVDRQWNLITKSGLNSKLKKFDIKTVHEKMTFDKKAKKGKAQFILTRKIGLVSIQQNLSSSAIYSALRQVQAEACEPR